MFVLGIDLSSWAVDCVKVPLEAGRAPVWSRFELAGADAFDRARAVRDAMPCRTSVFYDDVLACGAEDPRGQSAGVIYRVQGAVLACLPPHLLVYPLVPSQWRRLVGLKGNASKQDVAAWALATGDDGSDAWPQDAYDALAIGTATRALISTGAKEEAA